MFDQLSSKLTGVFNRLKGYGKLSEKNIDDALREVRMALLEADVNVGVIRTLLEKVKQKALGQEFSQSLSPDQKFFQIVRDELIAALGHENQSLVLEGKPPHVIMLVGLQGSGKTTTAGKLANYYKKKGRRPMLFPADVYRPAAILQLKQLANRLEVPCFDTHEGDKPHKIVKKAKQTALDRYCDIVILDTAGRLHIDDQLMDELKDIKKSVENPVVIFVADAMTGQEAVNVAKRFHDVLKLDGIILTKLDGDAKGGAALSIQQVAGCPIYFTGMGEKIDELEPYHPDRMVSRLLDQGDILSLLEKADQVIDKEQSVELSKKILKQGFTIEDFRAQLKQIKKLGSMGQLLNFLPGAKQLASKVNLDDAEKDFRRKEAIINSMTMGERLNPKILNGNRRLRIAKGSGTQVSDVNRFLNEFEQMQKMFGMFKKGGMKGIKNLLR